MPTIGDNLDEAARRLRAGETVAFATETVYGLGAMADNPHAIAAMYKLKGRPRHHPAIIHLADFSHADKWAEVPKLGRRLAAAFMPGVLTLLLPARTAAIGDGKTVALRVPAHPQARQLLANIGNGVVAPSANRFGRLSPTTAAHVSAEFPDSDIYILDGGDCEVGIESTIVGCLSGGLSVLRPGAITAAQIAEVAGQKLSPAPTVAVPGCLPTHYAPQKPLFLQPAATLAKAGKNAAVLSQQRPTAVLPAHWRQATAEPRQYARRLYGLLRELDATDADSIAVETPPATSDWAAVRDRLHRAAQNNTST